MFKLIPDDLNIDFIGKRKIWLTISLMAVMGSLILLFIRGLNYGVDFTGGAEVQLKFQKALRVSELRAVMEKGGFKNLIIQQMGETPGAESSEFLIKFRDDDQGLQKVGERIQKLFAHSAPENTLEMTRIDVVGPQAGGELRKSGFLAMFYTLLCILIYVAIRFDYRYSPGAVLALFHDSVITLGIFVLTQKEFSLQIVAAILTIIGYSNNDTIIVYDRIRDTLKHFANRSFEENVNRSINETLSRTIMTSVTTLFVVLALMIFGGGVIHDFAFTMMIGIAVGTYSSIFVASPFLVLFNEWDARRKKKALKA